LTESEKITLSLCATSNGYKSLEDWYQTSPRAISKTAGGQALLRRARSGGSPASVLSLAFPNHKWLEWKFVNWQAHKWWDSKDNQRKFFDFLLAQRQQTNSTKGPSEDDIPFQLSTVTRDEIIAQGGSKLFSHYKSVGQAIASIYPHLSWPSTTTLFEAPIGTDFVTFRLEMEAQGKAEVKPVRQGRVSQIPFNPTQPTSTPQVVFCQPIPSKTFDWCVQLSIRSVAN